MDVTAALADTWTRTTDAVADLDDDGWARPTRAAMWDVRALTQHLLLDAQRALVALASPADGPPDVDTVTYWRPFHPSNGDGGSAHGEWVVRTAQAYRSADGLLDRWRTTSEAAARAVTAADLSALVTTQGHVLAVRDLASTLLVEATVHLLDLTLEVEGDPSPAALAHTRRVLEGLLGASLPDAWDDRTAVLLGTGRTPLDLEHRAALGDLADRFPLLG